MVLYLILKNRPLSIKHKKRLAMGVARRFWF
jgi:hypothetical protein